MAEGLQGEEIPPLILKKKIKMPAGHHGGAWKVAYADFVTAMMAFFLLLWLLNATTEEQMTGLSKYFAPPNISESEAGIGEALAGMSASVEGALRSASSPPTTSIVVPSYGSEETGREVGEEREDPTAIQVNEGSASPVEQEQEMLDDALSKLRQSIREDPMVRDLQDSIVFEVTEDGLLIQLLDLQRREMFEPGTDQMTRRAIQLLALISSIILELPNDIAITGHTDAGTQPGATDSYGNWELSGDRAAASRRWMVDNGFPSSRLVRVEGKADSQLLDRRNPESERNRRISILLLRDHTPEPAPAPGGTAAPVAAPSAPSTPARDSSGLAPPPLPPPADG
jgi:chemotaxis protein MotB